MAYNTSKGPRGFGDLQNEDDIDTQIDWDADKITFRTNNIARFVIDNTQISASGNATIVGNIVTEGNLSVSGTMAFTDISGSGTLQMVGATTLGNVLNVTGAMSGASTLAAASFSCDGAVAAAGNVGSTAGNVSASANLAGMRLIIENTTVVDKNQNAKFVGISGSGALQAVGATTLGNTLNVSGAVSGASTF